MVKRLFLLNGLAIIAVVLNHAAGWGFTAMFWWTDRYLPVAVPNWDQAGTFTYSVLAGIKHLSAFAVPSFLFVSGFFVAYAFKGSQQLSMWRIVRVRLSSLLIPYVIWSFAIFIGDALMGTRYSLGEYLVRLLYSGAAPPFYYVPVLSVCLLLSPLLLPIAKRHGNLLIALSALAPMILEASEYLRGFGVTIGDLANSPAYQLSFRWLVFFLIGIVCGFRIESLSRWLARLRGVLFSALILLVPLSLVGTELLPYKTDVLSQPDFVPVISNIYACVFILSFLAVRTTPIPFSNALYRLGSKSYGIYLLHFESMTLVAKFVYHFTPWILAWQVLYQPILFFSGLVLVVWMMEALVKTPAKRFSRILFG